MGFKLTHPLPKRCLVAVSGGVDSVAALHWLNQVPGRVKGIIHINHGTGRFANKSEKLVRKLSFKEKLPTFWYRLKDKPPVGDSAEEYWRKARYYFFNVVSQVMEDCPVVVAHQMDDCLENYIRSTMFSGHTGTIPYANGPCIRPFRLWKRVDIEEYARKNNLSWIEDPSNKWCFKYQRANIRHRIAPRIRELNPGIYRVVEEAVLLQDLRKDED